MYKKLAIIVFQPSFRAKTFAGRNFIFLRYFR